MFFTPRFSCELSGGKIVFTKETIIDIPDGGEYLRGTAARALLADAIPECASVCRRLSFSLGIPENIRKQIKEQISVSGNDEEYAIVIGEETSVWAESMNGLIYGLSTLMQLADGDELTCRLIYDRPCSSMRGYRMYLPGRSSIGTFKKVIDLLAYYKYNIVMLEIGGAMEYKRHPEINAKWVEFCADVRRYSGRTHEIQHKSYQWEKNSIHCDNGDGGYLTQEECRDIAAYCHERGMEVIPECPTLSHCDYIVRAHPELRERENDYDPDTYCPSNPETYKIVFDILDEVIDVFSPKRINIGHDEMYSLAICEKCRDKDPADLYAGDITKIHDYLASKGVQTMMWGEKLLRAIDAKSGARIGGWGDPHDCNGVTYRHPTLYPCADKLPRDILMMHWFWTDDPKLDDTYLDRDYKFIFANLSVIPCPDFRRRIDRGCVGGIVSNWGSNEDEYMQRNCQYYAMISTAYALWCDDYDDSVRGEIDDKTIRECYRLHYKGKKHLIKVVHTTDCSIRYCVFYDGKFIDDAVYLLGHYELSYSDGTSVLFPVKYGTNISADKVEKMSGYTIPDCCGCASFREVTSSTIPHVDGDSIYYECGFENPHPEKIVAGFRYIPAEGKEDFSVRVKSVVFE